MLAVFDLQAGGKRVGRLDTSGYLYTGWVGDHQIVTGVEPKAPATSSGSSPSAPSTPTTSASKPKTTGASTGHSPVNSVLSPELKVVQQAEFVLPSDPHGYCATWPLSWAPANQFPGAFVP